jgi:hypothetical protein
MNHRTGSIQPDYKNEPILVCDLQRRLGSVGLSDSVQECFKRPKFTWTNTRSITVKTNWTNLELARKKIAEIQANPVSSWFVQMNTPTGTTLHIEQGLLNTLSKLMVPIIREQEGEPDELAPGGYYTGAVDEIVRQFGEFRLKNGLPSENPAQGEVFLVVPLGRLAVMFATVDGVAYATGKEMFPF